MCRERLTGLNVPFPIPGDLGAPELPARGWHLEELTAVSVPEAAVYKHGRPIARQDQVWPPRQIACLEAKAKTTRMQPSSDEHFRLGVATADAAHVVTSPRRRMNVGPGGQGYAPLSSDAVAGKHGCAATRAGIAGNSSASVSKSAELSLNTTTL